MWTMLTDDKTGRRRRMIFILDDDDVVHYSGPSLFEALAWLHENGDPDFKVEGERGWAHLTLHSLHDLTESGTVRYRPLPPLDQEADDD